MPRMHLSLELHEEVPAGLPLELFEAAAEAALALGLPASFSEQSFSLTAVAVSQEEIQRLNREYRDKDSVTDILSFWNFASVAELLLEKSATIELGELFFAPEFIEQAAQEDAVSYRREMAYIFSHGVLHLIGYDHEPEMFRIQDRITDDVAPLLKDGK